MKLWFEHGAWASKKARKKIADVIPAQVEKIAVIRHAALGDMVLVRCFLIELRQHFPKANITLSIVSNYQYGVPHDLVDRVHVLYGSDQRHVSKWQQLRRARELGHQDLIFDLAATPRSFQLCLLTKAKLKLGFPYYGLQRSLFYDIAVFRSDLKFEAELMLDMLNVIGMKTSYPPNFAMPGIANKRECPYVMYFPSASIKGKCWPESSFIALIQQMAVRYPDYEHIVLEGTAKWESIDNMMEVLGDFQNITAMKAVSIEDTTKLLKGSLLLVCNDTGIRNLAITTKTPTCGIFFSTVPFRYWPRYDKHDVVYEPDGSIPSVEKVVKAAIDILDSVPK